MEKGWYSEFKGIFNGIEVKEIDYDACVAGGRDYKLGACNHRDPGLDISIFLVFLVPCFLSS